MKQLSLAIDLNRCIGCKTCVAACRNYHGLIDHASSLPGLIPYYLRVESDRQGTYPDIAIWSWYGQLAQDKLWPRAGHFLNVSEYKHLQAWTEKIAQRPAVKRGLSVEYQSMK